MIRGRGPIEPELDLEMKNVISIILSMKFADTGGWGSAVFAS